MTHTVRESGPWQHTVTIEVPVDDVDRQIDTVARDIQRRAVLPGFRKGKVPIERVRTQFADAIEREFLERFIPEVTNEALAEAKLSPVVPPMVQKLRFTPGQPLAFEAVVDVAPQVEVRDYQGLRLVRRVRPVSDEACRGDTAAVARGVRGLHGPAAAGRRR